MKGNRLSPPRHLAFFSPLPPERTGIADYSRELLPYLVKLTSVSIFTEYPRTSACGVAGAGQGVSYRAVWIGDLAI